MSLAEVSTNPREAIGANNPPPASIEDLIAEALLPFRARIESLADRAESLPKKIETDGQLGQAGDVAKDARALFREVEASRNVVKKPYLEATRLIDSSYATPKDRLDAMATRIETRASAYDREKLAAARRAAEAEAERLRKEEQRRADAAEAAAQAGRQAHAAQHLDKADLAASRAAEAEATARQASNDLTRTRSESGTVSSASMKWKGEILDRDALDLEKLRPYFPLADLQKALDQYVRTTCKGQMEAPPFKGARIFADVQTRFR